MDSLVQYIQDGSLDDIKTIINKGELRFDSDRLGYNLLKKSLIYQQKKITQFFIEHNFQVNPFLSVMEETPLHIAVKLRWKDIVELLLEKGASVEVEENLSNGTPIQLSFFMKEYELTDLMLPFDKGYELFRNKNEISHLHIACARNNVEVVKKYLQICFRWTNSVIESTNTKWAGYTPLHFAVEFKSIETVKLLLKCGANITAQDQKGNTPLHLAVELQNKLLVDLILSQHMYKYENPEDLNKLSHFHIACTRNNPKIVYGFLQCGVDINAKAVNGPWKGYTALHLAVVHRCIDVIKLLVAHNSSSRNYTEEFLFDLYETRNIEIQNLILSTKKISLPEEYTEEIPPIFEACILVQPDIIKSLIQLGVSVNKYLPLNSSLWPGATPLHIVANWKIEFYGQVKCWNTEIAKLLLENGADVSAIDAKGQTPIHVTFKSSENWLTQLLLKNYPKFHINLSDKDGLSVFHIACATNSIDVVDKFLSFENNGVDVNAAISDDSIMHPGLTPLHMAVRHGSTGVVKKLLQHNADLGLRDCSGVAPFNLINEKMMFCNAELRTLIVMILKKAYETNCTSFDMWGFNPLHVACMGKDEKTVERYVVDQNMINATIDKESSIYRGFTPLHFAILYGKRKTIHTLLNHGADPRIRNAEGDTPLHMIIHPTYGEPIEDFKMEIMQKKMPVDDDHRLFSEIKVPKYVDDRLFSLEENPFGSMGYSHFHIACIFGKLDIVKSFLTRGVEPNLGTRMSYHNIGEVTYNLLNPPRVGETGLHVSVDADQRKVMLLLLEHGADVNARDATLRAPLHCLPQSPNSPEIARLLLEQGHADVNARDYTGETPMHTTIRNGTVLGVLQVFVNADADINLSDENGTVALLHCVEYCRIKGEIVKVMVEHILRLDEAGCHVSEDNLNCLSRLILPRLQFNEELFRKRCVAELKRMGILRQILRIKNTHELRKFASDKRFRNLITNSIKKFPIYGELLQHRYQRGIKTKQLVEDITLAIKKLPSPKYWLSDECAEAILQYLTFEELQQLKKALTGCFPSFLQKREKSLTSKT